MTAARVAIVTVSDRSARGEREDVTGPRLAGAVEAAGHDVVHRTVVEDDVERIRSELEGLADGALVAPPPDIVLTAGGTGLGPRDCTPEATRAAITREAPGLGEAVRAAARRHTPHADLSRGIAGILGGTLIVNLPGSPGGGEDGWNAIQATVGHAAEQLRGTDHE